MKSKLNNDFLLSITGNLIQIFTTIYVVKMSISHIPLSQYGILGLLFTYFGIFNLIFFGPINTYFSRFFFRYHDENVENNYFIKYIIKINAIISIFIIVTALIIQDLVLNKYLFFSKSNYYLLVAYTISSSFYGLLITYLNSSLKREKVLIAHTTESIFKISLFTIFLSYFDGLNSYLLALLISSLSTIFILAKIFGIVFFKIPKINTNINIGMKFSDLIFFTYPLSITGIFSWWFLSIQRIAIDEYLNSDYLGIYYGYYQIFYTGAFSMISLILSYMSPIIYKKFNNNEKLDALKSISITVKFILIIYIFIAFLYEIFGGFFLDRLFTEDYLVFHRIGTIFILSAGIMGASQMLSTRLLSSGNTHAILARDLISSIVIGFIGFYLVKNFELMGAAYSTLASSLIYLILILLLIRIKKY